MKLSANFSDITLEDKYITPSELIEYSYCPRFIYYMNCVDIPQFEENRYLVQLGNTVHKKRATTNVNYLSNKLNVIDKMVDIEVFSKTYMLKGKIDELLFLENNKVIIVDFKNSVYQNKIYNTYTLQMTAYALMVEENFKASVSKAIICFLQNKKSVEIEINNNAIQKLKYAIEEYHKILNGYFPKATTVKSRCSDCCYRNICVM